MNPQHAAKAHPSIHSTKGYRVPRRETKTYAIQQSGAVRTLDPKLYEQGIVKVVKEVIMAAQKKED